MQAAQPLAPCFTHQQERWRHKIPRGMYIPGVPAAQRVPGGDRAAAAGLWRVHTVETTSLKQISCFWSAGVTHNPALGSAVPSTPIPSASCRQQCPGGKRCPGQCPAQFLPRMCSAAAGEPFQPKATGGSPSKANGNLCIHLQQRLLPPGHHFVWGPWTAAPLLSGGVHHTPQAASLLTPRAERCRKASEPPRGT